MPGCICVTTDDAADNNNDPSDATFLPSISNHFISSNNSTVFSVAVPAAASVIEKMSGVDARHVSDFVDGGDEDESEFNPLAEAMGAATLEVARKRQQEEAGGVVNDDDDEFEFDDQEAISSSIHPTPSKPTQPANSSSSSSSSSDFDMGRLQPRSGVTVSAVSSGHLDAADLAVINKARQEAAVGRKKKQMEEEESEVDEFAADEASLAPVEKQSLAAQQRKPNHFDEFEDVWEDANAALKSSNGSAAPPARKTLRASKAQRAVEKPTAKEDARLRVEQAREAAAKEEAERKEREKQSGLQNPLLEKLGMEPTNILAQYERPAADASSSAPAQTSKQSVRDEQRQLESNDAALAAQAAAAAPQKTNVVDALANAHAASSSTPGAVAASSSSSSSSPAPSSEEDQWSAVNALREQQEVQARAEAERLVNAPKSIGIKAAEKANRDTLIGYDQAVKAMDRYLAESGESTPPFTPGNSRLSSLLPLITIHDFRNVGAFRSARYKVFGAPRLGSEKLENECVNAFVYAKTPLDPDDVDHQRMLTQLYRTLTGDALSPPQYGPHWQQIGFQGTDPGTDLRGSGMMALLQLLYFARHHKSLMLRIYQLSLDDRQNFPFATLSTNLTGMVLQCLRECYKIYGEIRRRDSVLQTINQLYVAAYYDMYLRWKNGNCTIRDWNDVKNAVEDGVLHNPKGLMRKFTTNNTADGSDAGKDELEFTEIP